MAGTLKDFVNNYLANVGNVNEVVDITSLCEAVQILTPKQLQTSKPEEALSNMSTVIVSNFVKNYSDKGSYPMKGLVALCNIVNENVEEKSSRAKKTLMIHGTKLCISKARSTNLFVATEKMYVITEITQQLDTWHSLSKRTINHPEIIQLVDDLIKDMFGSVNENAKKGVTTNFVSNSVQGLRGFSGINEIFINVPYFMNNYEAIKEFEKCDSIVKIDLITISLHEYANVRLRQNLDDFNISTPNILMKLKKESDKEFGRLAELKLFRGQVDWYTSINTVNQNYVNSFIHAIIEGKSLPDLPQLNNFIVEYRQPSVLSGVDIETFHDIC